MVPIPEARKRRLKGCFGPLLARFPMEEKEPFPKLFLCRCLRRCPEPDDRPESAHGRRSGPGQKSAKKNFLPACRNRGYSTRRGSGCPEAAAERGKDGPMMRPVGCISVRTHRVATVRQLQRRLPAARAALPVVVIRSAIRRRLWPDRREGRTGCRPPACRREDAQWGRMAGQAWWKPKVASSGMVGNPFPLPVVGVLASA